MASVWRQLLRPFSPIIQTVRTYRAADLPRDLQAGVIVSIVDLPQSMAFALIAGVPPVYGLYTAIFLAFLGSLFTSSRYLSVGPTNTQSLLIAAIVSRLTGDPAVYVQLVIGLGLIKGLMQLGFAAARMGRLVRYVSRSVMVGFTAGAGGLIFLEQLPALLGLQRLHQTAERLPGALGAVQRLMPRLSEVRADAVLIGAGALVVLVVSRRISHRIPGPLVAVVGAALVCWALGWQLPLVGALPTGLPGLAWPQLSWAQVEALLPGALALALLGMLESVAIAKSIAYRTGQRISADQEFFGQGFANLVGSFLQCMPGSGSFSRTALQYAVGARTRVAGIVTAISNALVFLALGRLAASIPLASLAAMLVFVAYTLVDYRAISRIVRTSRADAVVCLGTLLAALFTPLTYAIYLGIFLNLALYLRRASQLHIVQMVQLDDGRFQEEPVDALVEQAREVTVLQLEGDIFFGVADELTVRLDELLRSRAQVVIFRLKRAHSLDASVLFALEQFILAMQASRRHVLLCGVSKAKARMLERFGLLRLLGEDRVFAASADLHAGTEQALALAETLLTSTAREDDGES